MTEAKNVYRLSDGELARALYLAARDVPHLLKSAWESGFVRGIEEGYVKFGRLTWKQRRACRRILARIAEILDRRATVRGGTP